MDWIFALHDTNPTAQAIATLAVVCVLGMSLGSIRLRGIKLGTSGVLFAAIVAGHFGKPIARETLEFIKEFGLILFVFCIGLQLGPGFFASFRRTGLRLNALATAIVALGALLIVGLGWLAGFDGAAVLGLLAGATTNTPSLGAAQQTLASFPGVSTERAALPALAYAVSYPAGIVGTIGSLLALRALFKIDVQHELAEHTAAGRRPVEPLERRALLVENANLQGIPIGQVPGLIEAGVVVSRIRTAHGDAVSAATRATPLHVGDHILAVGPAAGLDHFQRVIGRASGENLLDAGGAVAHRKVVVTNTQVLGRSLEELHLDTLFGVSVTRVTRGDLEMSAVPALRLQFGDVLQIVGPTAAIDQVAAQLGNSLRALNETQFVPFFAGISLGIALGTFPLQVPGLPQPLRLGLAAGPLIVAIVVGRLGRVGRLVWHIPLNANLAFREFGIALFFASVGLMAGPTFFQTAFSNTGLQWLLVGACVTVLPLLVVGLVARLALRMNYIELSGLLAGGMTDPPALAFANGICESEAPAVAYATVYPWTMLLRIIAAQALTVVLCG